jgi:hypothetical protein
VSHEGGHVVTAVVSGRGSDGFKVHETTGGGVTRFGGGWGFSLVLIFLAGYPSPPLLGLGGAMLVADGRAWAVLWIALALLLPALFEADGLFTTLVVLLAGIGVGWAAVAGSPGWQAGVAVGLVWLMLFGGVRSLFGQGLGKEGSDAARLRDCTWIPATIWAVGFWIVAMVCLWKGAGLMLGLEAAPPET